MVFTDSRLGETTVGPSLVSAGERQQLVATWYWWRSAHTFPEMSQVPAGDNDASRGMARKAVGGGGKNSEVRCEETARLLGER